MAIPGEIVRRYVSTTADVLSILVPYWLAIVGAMVLVGSHGTEIPENPDLECCCWIVEGRLDDNLAVRDDVSSLGSEEDDRTPAGERERDTERNEFLGRNTGLAVAEGVELNLCDGNVLDGGVDVDLKLVLDIRTSSVVPLRGEDRPLPEEHSSGGVSEDIFCPDSALDLDQLDLDIGVGDKLDDPLGGIADRLEAQRKEVGSSERDDISPGVQPVACRAAEVGREPATTSPATGSSNPGAKVDTRRDGPACSMRHLRDRDVVGWRRRGERLRSESIRCRRSRRT